MASTQKGKSTTGKKRGRPPSKAKSNRGAYRKQKNHIFALDIGTRTVVGIVGYKEDDKFIVIAAESVEHPKRAMIDGQIENISQVAKIVTEVKSTLEKRLRMRLERVSIAAAGRALKTHRITAQHDVEGRGVITEELLKSLEIMTIGKAQEELEGENKDDNTFYPVGHSVVDYWLDDYKISNLVGHKGQVAKIEIIAAFLPNPVIESLYAVMEECFLNVEALTLEPIAAMNVIIPKEIRLINIALVDIGAGTADIAITRDGSVVAYAMTTIAGDEITEEIIRKYLVDFKTAEQMKADASEDIITYKDIFGIEHSISTKNFYESLISVIDLVAETIIDNIIAINGGPPAAVFLIGGGGQIATLCEVFAKRLELPENRVAVGGNDFLRDVETGDLTIKGPEFVTPIGIAVTSTLGQCYDFSTITLNDEPMRIFDTKDLTILNLLTISGYSPRKIFGRSGKSLTFTLNGERNTIKGTPFTPSQIYLNGQQSSIDSPISQGDEIRIIPAINGKDSSMTIADLTSDIPTGSVFIDGIEYDIGANCTVNGSEVNGSYQIAEGDTVEVVEINTLREIISSLKLGRMMVTDDIIFSRNGEVIDENTSLNVGDEITTTQKKPATGEAVKAENPPVAGIKASRKIRITLNGRIIELPFDEKDPPLFLELLNFTDIDPQNPRGDIILTLNGKVASYVDALNDGDIAVIKWAMS